MISGDFIETGHFTVISIESFFVASIKDSSKIDLQKKNFIGSKYSFIGRNKIDSM